MALHPSFPLSPYAELLPDQRWFPADETLREKSYDKLLPPLVAKVREEVFAWRHNHYAGASDTSKALLEWWFETDHLLEEADGSLSPFRYYYAQREAVETVVWLYEVRQARDKFDLIRFDASGAVSSGMFHEDWPRYVLKMATGAGKTKVLSLLITWSFFHRLYEKDSQLSRNFLVIAPNIIVLDRLRADFDGLKVFFNDPVLPPNGHGGQNWRDDFQLTVHIQDDVRVVRESGNLFLTNVHRVFLGDVPDPSLDDDDLSNYFLEPFGARPSGRTTDSKTDLGEIIRKVDELAIFNDEAHHIHVLTRQWTDWVDYWAVDFNYESRKEIILQPKNFGTDGALPGIADASEFIEFEERWTGSYIFENEWQSFRTRKDRSLELASIPHVYDKPGRYVVAVKVIDIFGNDTMTLVPVTVG